MNFHYSVIRFVPDPAHGELVNVGVLVVRENPVRAVVRMARSPVRARHLAPAKVVKGFWDYMHDLRQDIERDARNVRANDVKEWFQKFAVSDQSMVQFSALAPLVG